MGFVRHIYLVARILLPFNSCYFIRDNGVYDISFFNAYNCNGVLRGSYLEMDNLARITCICPDCGKKHVKMLNPYHANNKADAKIDGKPAIYCDDCLNKRLEPYKNKY
jgi:hypothetical protein